MMDYCIERMPSSRSATVSMTIVGPKVSSHMEVLSAGTSVSTMDSMD